MPRIKRPLDTRSIVAAVLASTAGCRNVVGDTNDPIRRLSVIAAMAAMTLQHS